MSDEENERILEHKNVFNLYSDLNLRSTTITVFKSPEALLRACLDYIRHMQENKIVNVEKVDKDGKPTNTTVHHRAMTIVGLCAYLNIGRKTWLMYREKEEYEYVCEKIENIIWQDKFELASAGLLNPVIIMRELGLADKQTVEKTEVQIESVEWIIDAPQQQIEHQSGDQKTTGMGVSSEVLPSDRTKALQGP